MPALRVQIPQVIVVDQDAYEATIQFFEPVPEKEEVGKNRAKFLAMTEKLEESYSPVTTLGAFAKSREARLAQSTNLS